MSTAKTQSSSKKARRTKKIATQSMERMVKDIIIHIENFQDSFYTRMDDWYEGQIATEGFKFAEDIKARLIKFVDKLNDANEANECSCATNKINLNIKEYVPPIMEDDD